MKVYEVVCWKFDSRSMGLWVSEARAREEARRLLAEGELLNPLYSIVEREVQE